MNEGDAEQRPALARGPAGIGGFGLRQGSSAVKVIRAFNAGFRRSILPRK